MKIAVAGTGYVGLSIATLLSQHNDVTAVDIIPEKVELINSRRSPIQDEYIEKYLAEKTLRLTATLDAEKAYADADFIVIADLNDGDEKEQRHSPQVPKSRYTNLCIDLAQTGVGGVDSWSKNGLALPEYRVEYKDRVFRFVFITVR